MALKVFVKLQTPVIELKVEAKDASGAKDSLVVGFKRYEVKETESKLEQLQTIFSSMAENPDEIIKYIKNEVVYIKQAKLLLEDENGKEKELTIVDSRVVKPVETLWETSEECLDTVLDLYLSSAPYRVSFMTALQKALINNDYSEGELKN